MDGKNQQKRNMKEKEVKMMILSIFLRTMQWNREMEQVKKIELKKQKMNMGELEVMKGNHLWIIRVDDRSRSGDCVINEMETKT